MNNVASLDRKRFEEVYKKYRDDIFLYAKQYMRLSDEDAEDITGVAFLELLKIWPCFDPKTDQAVFAWLRKTAQFLTYNKNKKNSKLPTVPLEIISNISVNTDIPETLAEKDLYEKMMQKIKNDLNSEEYQLFEDIIVKGRNITLIAKEKNINVNTLNSRWLRLQKKIRKNF